MTVPRRFDPTVVGTDGGRLADLRLSAENMVGREALPVDSQGEPIYQEPWQGRAVAVAVETVARLNLPWDAFRTFLISAIEADPQGDYYEAWLVALERLAQSHQLLADDQLDRHRFSAASYRTGEQSHDDLEVFPVMASEEALHSILSEIFLGHWSQIRFGPVIQGAAYELRATERPQLAMLDGYLTIDLGPSHLHLCIGETTGTPEHPTASDLARTRQCSHAELQRQWVDGAPMSWMFRMFNGDGDQQLTVLLPNPFLDDDQNVLATPDWLRLELWDSLRSDYLGLPPDPADRLASKFIHG